MEMRAAQLSVWERSQPYELSNHPSVQNGVPGMMMRVWDDDTQHGRASGFTHIAHIDAHIHRHMCKSLPMKTGELYHCASLYQKTGKTKPDITWEQHFYLQSCTGVVAIETNRTPRGPQLSPCEDIRKSWRHREKWRRKEPRAPCTFFSSSIFVSGINWLLCKKDQVVVRRLKLVQARLPRRH